MKWFNLKNYSFLFVVALAVAACSSDDKDSQGGSGEGQKEPNVNRNTAYTDAAATRMELPHLLEGNSRFIVYRTID